MKSVWCELIAYCLVVSFGITEATTFFEPWIPGWLHVTHFIVYEPILPIRIFEGIMGIAILGFGIERVIFGIKRYIAVLKEGRLAI